MAGCLSAALVLFALACPQSSDPAAPNLSGTIRPGLAVTVVDSQGAVREGRVAEVTDDGVRLVRSGRFQDISVDDIVRIEKSDSLRNGAFTGLALGLFAGALPVMLTDPPSGSRNVILAGSIIGNAVIWTALGAGLDALVDGRRTLYERGRRRAVSMSPLIGRSRAGAALQVSW